MMARSGGKPSDLHACIAINQCAAIINSLSSAMSYEDPEPHLKLAKSTLANLGEAIDFAISSLKAADALREDGG